MLEPVTSIDIPGKRRQRIKVAGVPVVAGLRGYLDFEVRCVPDFRIIGQDNWLGHPTAEVMCAAWAVGKKPGLLWLPDDAPPEELFAAEIIVAHNAAFEYMVVQRIMHPKHGWPRLPIERFSCTMARNLAVGYPAGLGKAADAYALKNRKDVGGQRLMHSTVKPRKPRKGEDPSRIYWHEDEERLRRLRTYVMQDMEVLRELDGVVPELSKFERQVWLLDHRVNFEHGFGIDRKLATAAYKIAQQIGPKLDREIARLTGGAATGVNQVARLLRWAQAQGYTGKSLSRDAIERFLAQGDQS